MAMNPEIKAQWVAALRSGEYQQGTGRLNAGGRYCCLGVLCELAVKAGIATKDGDEDESLFKDLNGEMGVSYPPHGVAEWAGLSISDDDVFNPILKATPEIEEKFLVESARAGSWNDTIGANFKEIADMIEQDPEL